MEPFGCMDMAWRNGESARGAQAQEEQEQPPCSPSTGGNPKSWKQRVTLPQARCSQALPRSPFSSAQHRWAGDKASQRASTGVSNTLLLSFKLHLLSSPHTSAGTGHPKQLNPTYFFFPTFTPSSGAFLCGAGIMGFGLDFESHSFPIKDQTTATSSSSKAARDEFNKHQFKAV